MYMISFQVLKQDTELRTGLRKLESNPANAEQTNAAREQLTSLALRKENLLKMIGLIEADISVKEKEASKAK